MKIALVIFPFGPSHGSILQTYALFTKLEELGHDVQIIIRRKAPLGITDIIKRTAVNIKNRIKGIYHGPIFYAGNTPRSIMKNLQPFINSYFGDRVNVVYSLEESRNFANCHSFDAYIVGSDQVWRPKYVVDIYHYFLDFVPDKPEIKKIAFCPSFGTDEWEYNDEQTDKCKQLLSHFDAVAVREGSGVQLCKKFLNKNAIHLEDPTVLYTMKKYIDEFLDNKDTTSFSEISNMVGVYFLDINSSKLSIMEKTCSMLHMKSQMINHSGEYNSKIEDRIAPSLSTWIDGFYKAKYIITDSFHATMFAILFNKPFITIPNLKRGADRFYSLLQSFELQNRIISDSSSITKEFLAQIINWEAINGILKNKQIRSVNFLIESLKQ